MTEPNIYEKLSLIQNELKAPKNQYNKFGKYNYRNCEDILEAVKPLCNKFKCTLIISDEIQRIGDRYYVMSIATLHDWESDSKAHNTSYAREEDVKKGMDGSQITGSTSSYARKYALNGLFSIDDVKDADTGYKKEESDNRENEKVLSQWTKQWSDLRLEMNEKGIDYRGEKMMKCLLKLGIENQSASNDIQHMINVCNGYKEIIRLYDEKNAVNH